MRYAKLLPLATILLLPQAASAGGPLMLDQFVVVGSNGTLMRSSGGLSVVHLSAGQYLIESSLQINHCAYSVTAGAGQPSPSTATATGGFEDHNAVRIATYDKFEGHADASFHLIVKCSNVPPAGSATVDADGTLVRGVSATAATRIGTGAYNVTFSNSAFSTTCAYTASIGSSGTSGVSDPGFAEVAPEGAGTITVSTYDTKGDAADRGFHIYAACNL